MNEGMPADEGRYHTPSSCFAFFQRLAFPLGLAIARPGLRFPHARVDEVLIHKIRRCRMGKIFISARIVALRAHAGASRHHEGADGRPSSFLILMRFLQNTHDAIGPAAHGSSRRGLSEPFRAACNACSFLLALYTARHAARRRAPRVLAFPSSARRPRLTRKPPISRPMVIA